MPAIGNSLGIPFRGAWSFASVSPVGPGFVGYYPPFDDPAWSNTLDEWTLLSPTEIEAGPDSDSLPYEYTAGDPLTFGNWYRLEFTTSTAQAVTWRFAISGESFSSLSIGVHQFDYFHYSQPEIGGIFFASDPNIISNFTVVDTVEPAQFELDADGLPWYNEDGTLEYLPTP